MKKSCLSFCLSVLMATACMLSGADDAMEWQSFTFTLPMKVKDEMKDVSFKVQLPKKTSPAPIRGVIRHNDSFMAVAYKQNLAVVSSYDEGNDRGPSIKFLVEAAKACQRPEIEYAGAVGLGCSASGRKAAQWAGFNHERSLAVILDHSFAGAVSDKPHYDYGNLPIVPGVPMCFTETHDDLYQGADRRTLHYNWCTSAFRDYKQPCTASIYFEPSKHCQVKSRELQAVWLDEVLSLRIPKVIPEGKPYKLVPVTIQAGGMIKADLAKKENGRTYHDKVIIAPSQSIKQHNQMNFWVPGPQTAAKYVEWVENNGGTVTVNKASVINTP